MGEDTESPSLTQLIFILCETMCGGILLGTAGYLMRGEAKLDMYYALVIWKTVHY